MESDGVSISTALPFFAVGFVFLLVGVVFIYRPSSLPESAVWRAMKHRPWSLYLGIFSCCFSILWTIVVAAAVFGLIPAN